MKDKFLEFIASVMDVEVSEISLETTYGDFEPWDSMMMLTLIMETEDEYDVTIPMEEVGKIKTLNDLFAYVEG